MFLKTKGYAESNYLHSRAVARLLSDTFFSFPTRYSLREQYLF